MLLGSLTMQLVLCTHGALDKDVRLPTRVGNCSSGRELELSQRSSADLLVMFCSQITVFSFMWITSENASAAIV